ncbi:MAG: 23S rRNA (uracil(1939)-C(5))-methyltransferase RlmD [Patescibacteria group bacterium]
MPQQPNVISLKKGATISLRIEKLEPLGRGVGFYDGIPFFVEDCMPGDNVEVLITRWKKTFGEGLVSKLVEPSPDRIAPKCKHFGTCGGCRWQFLPYDKQLSWKEDMVRSTLKHVGKFSDEEITSSGVDGGSLVRSIVGNNDPYFYRNKMEWSFDGDRGGFHIRGKWHEVVNVEECFLQSEASVEIFKVIRDFFKGNTPRSVIVREGKRTGEMMVVVMTCKTAFDYPSFVKALAKFPKIVSIVHVETGIKRHFPEHVIFGPKFYREELHVRDAVLKFQIQARAFFQPNTLMAEKIYEQVLDFAAPGKDDLVLDLFCGTGTIGLALSKFCSQVVGIEVEPHATASATENAKLNDVSNIRFETGFVENVLPKFEGRPSIIVVDPPRIGLPARTLEDIIKFHPQKIVYVSCNPASFARDAAELKRNNYTLCTVQPFDQFPQTAHIELVALFQCE